MPDGKSFKESIQETAGTYNVFCWKGQLFKVAPISGMLVKRRALFTCMNTPRFPFHHLERRKGIKPDPRTFVARLWLWKCALMFGDKLQAENSDAKSTQSHAEDNAQAPCLNNKRLLHHGRLTSSCLKTPAKTAVLCKLLVWAKMASSQGNMWQTWCIIFFSALCSWTQCKSSSDNPKVPSQNSKNVFYIILSRSTQTCDGLYFSGKHSEAFTSDMGHYLAPV